MRASSSIGYCSSSAVILLILLCARAKGFLMLLLLPVTIRRLSEVASDLPDLREKAFGERTGEVLHAAGAAGPFATADHALDHRDVAEPPQQQALVEVDHR